MTLTFCLFFGIGCHLSDPCDPGQVYDEDTVTCLDAPEDAGSITIPVDAAESRVDGGGSVDAGGADGGVSVDGGGSDGGGSDGGGSDGGGSGSDAAGGVDVLPADSGACQESHFGRPCVSSDECGCDTTFCAAQPGTTGFCTVTHCLASPEICPLGFTCVDITAFAPQLESLCGPS